MGIAGSALRTAAGFFPPDMPWRVVAFGYLMTLSSMFGQTHFIALFNPLLREEFGLSHSMIGGIFSVATVAAAVMLVRTGKLIDRFDVRYFTAVVNIGLAIGCFILAFAQTAGALAVGFFLQRLFGQGLSSHTAITVTARLAMTNRGKSLSMVMLGFATGEMIAPALVTFLLIFLTWRSIWFGAAIFQLLIFGLIAERMLRHLDNRPPLRNKDRGDLPDFAISWSRIQVLGDARFWKTAPLIYTPPFFVTALLFHQGSLAQSIGYEFTSWALGFTAFPICAAIVSLLGGQLADTYGCRRPLLFSSPLVMAGMAIALFPAFGGQQYLYYALIGCGIGFWAPGFNSLWREIYGPAHLGANLAMANSLAVLSSAASPLLFGLLLDIRLPWLLVISASIAAVAIGYGSFLSTPLTAVAPPKKRVPSLASRIR